MNVTEIPHVSTPTGISWGSFIVALTLYLAGLLLSFARWYVLLRSYGVKENFTRVSIAYLSSYAVFTFTPLGRLSSEGYRVTLILKDKPGSGVIASVAYERMLDGLSILGLFIGLIIGVILGLNPLYLSVGFMVLIPFILSIQGSLSRFSIGIEKWANRLPKVGKYLSKFMGGEADFGEEPEKRTRVTSALTTIVMWVLNMFHIAVLLKALGLNNVLLGAPAVLLVEMLGLGLPVPIPAGLGVMDSLTAITLKAAGLGTSFVGQYLIIERVIISIIPGLLGLLAMVHLGVRLIWRRKSKDIYG
ncbi:MAG: flippase-like domain-containing protein [Desulfurococcales archaeon]|nr:flippase-like domain-containing protein [Desulfurococcales archaeon]